MAYNFSPLKDRIKEVQEWLSKEFTSIRTGRATPALLDSVQVESYGARMPISQVGSISVEDPRTLRISPWDVSQVKEIEKAIIAANLGVSVSVDDKGARVFFPELTSERRTILMKLAKERLEDARVSLRKERDQVWNEIQAKEKEGGMGEDEKFRYKDEMQKYIDEANKKLEELFEKKEKEITS
jgi:ribosome recycling factor